MKSECVGQLHKVLVPLTSSIVVYLALSDIITRTSRNHILHIVCCTYYIRLTAMQIKEAKKPK